MIIESFNFNGTEVNIHDDYIVKTEKERDALIEVLKNKVSNILFNIEKRSL